MSEEAPTTSNIATEMSAMQKIIGIFSAPRQTFEAIDQKPTWVLPFLIVIIFVLIHQLLVMDISTADGLKLLESRDDIPQEQLNQTKEGMQGPLRYLGLIAAPIGILLFYLVLAAIIYITSNLMIGGDSSFKKVFAIVNWSGIVGIIGLVLITIMALSKGTMHGIGMDLSILLDTPGIGQEKSTLYRIFSKFDVFTIWQISLWAIGLSVSYKAIIKKTVVPILVLWLLWIIISVSLGGLPIFQKMGM